MGTNTRTAEWQKRFNWLFNHQLFGVALRYLQRLPVEVRMTSDFWIKTALCYQQSPYGSHAVDAAILMAQQCPDWHASQLDSFLRDQVIHAIKFGHNLDEAETTLHKLALRAPDDNYMACFVMIDARLHARRAKDKCDRQFVLQLHRRADGMWNSLGDKADAQWIANNAWHMLLNSYRLNGVFARRKQQDFVRFEAMVRQDPALKRRVFAKVLRFAGRPLALKLSY